MTLLGSLAVDGTGSVHRAKALARFLLHYLQVGAGRDDGKQKGEYCAIFFDK
jgi:hypothetical protein